MKISIIGAGNVGSLTAMRIAQENPGQIILVDVIKGLAQGKSLDLEDARQVLKCHYAIEGTDEIEGIKDSDIIVVTAGLTRKPGMTREDLLIKNAQILKEICLQIKKLAGRSIVIVVTNPLDLMTYLALKITGFSRNRAFGMGVSLDASRFANLISKELGIPAGEIEPCVIGSHGEGMLPIPRLTMIKGKSLLEYCNEERVNELVRKTVGRGAEIVSLLGSGSAYFAPSAAIADIVKSIVNDEKRKTGLCVSLEGEYRIQDCCLGLPCQIGGKGIDKILTPDLTPQEKNVLLESAQVIRKHIELLKPFLS